MNRNWSCVCLILAAVLLVLPGCKGKAGQESSSAAGTGASASETSDVRSATLTTSGAISGTFKAASDYSSSVLGTCPRDMWANFGIKFRPEGYEWANVALMTKKPIPAGYTGEVQLEWMDVSFFDVKTMTTQQFKGPAALAITHHDSSGSPRLAGVLRATELKGYMDSEGKTIDARFDFDLNFACGR